MMILPNRPEEIITLTALWSYMATIPAAIETNTMVSMQECVLAYALQRRWVRFDSVDGYKFQVLRMTPGGERELEAFMKWTGASFWPLAFAGEAQRSARKRATIDERTGEMAEEPPVEQEPPPADPS